MCLTTGSRCLLVAATAICTLIPTTATADKLRITSAPSGASIHINGVLVGTTPYEKDIPGGYLHKTKTTMGSRLEHPMVARLTLDGYAAKEIQLTEGPMNWVSLKGHNYGGYWLLKTDHFHFELQPASQIFTGGLENASAASEPRPPISLEELVRQTKPAVVYLKSLSKSGTGFFVTETGVIVTNAHLTRGEEALIVTLPDGTKREAKIVYIDPELDIALAKVPGAGPISRSPTPREFAREKVSWLLAILAMPCSSALPRELSAPSAASMPLAREPGYRPMPPSIPAIAAAPCLIRAGKSSASIRKNS